MVAVSYLSVDPGMRRCDVIDYDMIVIGARQQAGGERLLPVA